MEEVLNTLWWNNTTYFGIRSVKPHVDMKWGVIAVHTDPEGREYLQFQERQSKTCQRDNPVSVRTTLDVRLHCSNCMPVFVPLIIPLRIVLFTLQQTLKSHPLNSHGLSDSRLA